MLLASWTGPPDYERDVPIELKECLEMCFAKEAEKRPTAAALLQCSFLRDNLDESVNLTEHLNLAAESIDNLNDSGLMLHDQIARAVTRHSFCAPDKPGGSFISGSVGNAGGRHREAANEDSTMGGIDRQIMMRERMKQKQKEDKLYENDRDRDRDNMRDRDRDRDRGGGQQQHYQLNMPSGRGGERGGGGGGVAYSPYGYDHSDRDRDRDRDRDPSSAGDGKRLSPKE